MDKIKTISDIEVFACRIGELYIDLPENVQIQISLDQEDFEKIIRYVTFDGKISTHNIYQITFNTQLGIKFLIKCL